MTATKGQLAAHRWEMEEQIQQGQEEKERAFRKLLELEGRMKQARTKARGDLARLILQSNTALKALGKVVAKVRAEHQGGATVPSHPALTLTPVPGPACPEAG